MSKFYAKSICLLLLSLLALGARAQSVQFRRQAVDTRPEGSGVIYSAAEDTSGLVWLAALDGLWRYDGSRFELYKGAKDNDGRPVSLARVSLARFFKKDPNLLWLGTNTSGFFSLDIRSGLAQHYRHDPTNTNSPGGNSITAIHETADGVIWITSNNFTLTRFDGKNFKRYTPSLNFPGGPATLAEGGLLGSMAGDPTDPNRLWIGSRFGLFRFDARHEQFEFFPFPEVMRLYYEGNIVYVYAAPDGIVWSGGFQTGLMRLEPASGQWKVEHGTKPILNGSLVSRHITGIFPYSDGRLMIPTSPEMLWLYDPITGSSEFISPYPYSGNSNILSQHRKNPSKSPVWYIRTGETFYRLTIAPKPFTFNYLAKRNPALNKSNWQRAHCFSPDKKYLFIGTLNGNGLLRYDWRRDTIVFFQPPPDPLPNIPDVLFDDLCFDPDGKTLWIGTNQGLMVLEGSEVRRFGTLAGAVPNPQASRPPGPQGFRFHISAIFADETRVWLGTQGNGIFILEKSTGEIRPLFRPNSDLFKLTSTTRKILRDRRGMLWLCTDEGLLCLDPANESVLEKFLPENEVHELLHGERVSDIQEDSLGNLWVATYGGLHRFDPTAPRGQRLRFFPNTEIDLANYINDIQIAQQDGRIWLATENAYSVFDPSTGRFSNFTPRDGIFIQQRTLVQLPNGIMFSGGNQGFHTFDPQKFQTATPPTIYWRDFRVFDRPTAQSGSLNYLNQLTLQPGENHFSFEFGAINFEENASNSFAYQLEGYDRDWIFSGERTFASYTNLSPGNYRFRVKAANRNGVWSATRSLELRILPPFYQTWWFTTLLVVALALFSWQAMRAWEERRQAKEAQRIIDYFANSSYTGRSVDEILWDLTRNCISRLNFEDMVIYLLDTDRQLLVQKAAIGVKSSSGEEILNAIELPIGKGIVGTVAQTGRAEIIGDTSLDPRYVVDIEKMHSEITVPIIHDGRVIGVLDSEHPKKHFFKPQHLDILQSIANLVAAQIVKAEAEENLRRKEAEVLELDKRLAESELTALKAQMNPHFLFNCLNSINWYIVKNRPLEASKYLTKFSRLIRLILDNSKFQKIPLASELETLRLYIEMESIRFEQKFDFQIIVSENLDPEEVKIAPMILQPYVENAIWHGLMPLEGKRPGQLRVEVSRQNGHLNCVIEDNGIGREAARKLQSGAVGSRESRGMRITAERISILNQNSDGDFVQVIDIEDVDGAAAGTRVNLKLPIE